MKLLLSASIGALALATMANAETVRYEVDLTGLDYDSLGTVIYSDIVPAAANAQVIEFGWEDVELDVYHNIGATFENYGLEAFMGAWMEDTTAPGFSYYGSYAFPSDLGPTGGPGSVLSLGPATGGFDLSAASFYLDDQGTIEFYLVADYDDGTGLPAGTYTAGTLFMVVDLIPAPGAIALLGIAGLTGTRRRR
jgi:hypothetical protein